MIFYFFQAIYKEKSSTNFYNLKIEKMKLGLFALMVSMVAALSIENQTLVQKMSHQEAENTI